MPDPAIETTERVIRDLLAGFTMMPEQIAIEATERPGRIYWSICASREDTPQVVGKRGAHAKPLQLLVREFGKAREMAYDLRIDDPPYGPVTDASTPPRKYDAEATEALIGRVVEELGVSEYHIESGSSKTEERNKFHFHVYVRTPQDWAILTDRVTMPNGFTSSPAESLEALLRAGASRDQVRVFLEVKRG
jgi:predicted RNA-binding protein YlqC (UPF0109 family)